MDVSARGKARLAGDAGQLARAVGARGAVELGPEGVDVEPQALAAGHVDGASGGCDDAESDEREPRRFP